MEKTSNLFKIIGDTKGIFHAMISTIKYKNCKDVIEQKRLKKR